jgi:hypothetical protein
MASKTKLKIIGKGKLNKKLNDYIIESKYPLTKKPLIRTGAMRSNRPTLFQLAEQQHAQGLYDDFPVAPIDAGISTAKRAREMFDKVTYPLKTIIGDKYKKLTNVEEMVFKTYRGKPNCIRYYTKNKYLNELQCTILYLDEDIRSVYGFLINDKPLTDSNLLRYLAKVTEIEEKASVKLSQKIGTLMTKADQSLSALREMSSPVKTNPDGSRKPLAIQMGLNSYMERNKLKNPTGIIDSHVLKEKLKIYDFYNLGSVLAELNITAKEAFDYVCKYLNKNRELKRKHTEDRELYRGATALGNLIDFYKGEVKRTTILKLEKPKTKVFTYKNLMNSPEYAQYCKQAEVPVIRVERTFSRWFKSKLDIINKVQK